MRVEILVIAERLAATEDATVSLDQVAEALGNERVTPDEIDRLFAWLEERGKTVGEPLGQDQKASELLATVLDVARALRGTLGRSPSPHEIALASELSVGAVRRALWFARVLQR